MKCPFYLLLLVFLNATGSIYGQQQQTFVACASNSIFGDAHNILASVDLSNCTSRYIDTLPVGVYTIAATPNGKLWAMNSDTLGYLYNVDTGTGNLTYMGAFDTHGDFVQTMGVLNDSVLLIQCNSDLYGVTTSNVHSFRIGAVGNYRFGDITWLGQDLYIMGCTGNPDSMFLVKVTFNNNSYPPIANAGLVSNNISVPRCYALATVKLPNTEVALVGFADSNAYIINPTDGSYTLYCSVLPDSLGHFSDAAAISYPSIPIIIDTTDPTGIVSPLNNGAIVKLYPNPTSKEITITYDSNNEATFILADLTGRTMLHMPLIKGIQSLNVAPLPEGQYIAMIQTADRTIYRYKIVKQ